jgi:hypothetical protein
MGRILNTLEEQLKNQLSEGETLKTWGEWQSWLQAQGCPFELNRPSHLPQERPLSYQKFLEASESQLNHHPEWQARLCTPSWLQKQRIKLVPKELKKSSASLAEGLDLDSLQTELTRLVDQIHNVQQQMGHLESGTTPSKPQLAREISEAARPGARFNAVAGLMGRPDATLMLQRELNVAANLEKPLKKKEEDLTQPEIVPLNDAYLTFNRWLDQLEDIHLELDSFFKKPLRIPSSHEISFVQFCHRLERESTQPEELRQALEAFERLRQNGVDLNLPEKEFDLEESDSENPTFQLPDEDVYKNFGDWVSWLQQEGIDPVEFTSQDLGSMSSHQISFPQFCRRLERRLDDPEGFRNKLETA